MKKAILFAAVAIIAAACAPKADFASMPEATYDQVARVEPLSWWTGMNTPLQLLVQGPEISQYSVAVEGAGLRVKEVHKADSPNFLFLDIRTSCAAAKRAAASARAILPPT